MPVLRPQTFVVEHASPWDAFAAVWLRFEGPKLMRLSSGGAWSLNGSSSAACPRPAFIPKHDPPSEDCLCGLYGEKTADKVIEELSRLSLMSSWLKLSRPRIGPDWQAQGGWCLEIRRYLGDSLGRSGPKTKDPRDLRLVVGRSR